MKVYKPMLRRRQDVCITLQRTPFWSLLKNYMDGTLITSERKRKSDLDLIKIINCYNPTTKNNDVVQIFGLNNEGINMRNIDKSTKFGDDDRLIKKYCFTHMRTPCSITAVYKLWNLHHLEFPQNLDYLFKMLGKANKKKMEEGEEPTISGCTILVLYWICLHTNLVETIKGQENIIPAIAR
ncbi:unnamed protein product [Malus baccata var. baccata]